MFYQKVVMHGWLVVRDSHICFGYKSRNREEAELQIIFRDVSQASSMRDSWDFKGELSSHQL
jgi:hypothetical protein